MSTPNQPNHTGHRKRLRQQFVQGGLDALSDFKALEMLLFYAIPRKDTAPLAKALLNKFGSYERVMEAPLDELLKVSGMSENAAILLQLVMESERRYIIGKLADKKPLTSVDECGKYFLPFFHGRREEMVYLLALDGRGRVISCQCIGHGAVNSANVPIRKIVAAALVACATSVALAHNHPSGVTTPSPEDRDATTLVEDALRAMDIVLLDHFVIAGGEYLSIKEYNWDHFLGATYESI